MYKYSIGQYGSFDYNKFHRDYKPSFHGIEACLFEKEEDTINLVNEAMKHGFEIGIHFPLRAGQSEWRDALFLSSDETIYQASLELIQRELEYLISVKPRYVLFHYPKPIILDDRVDWTTWRFTDPLEYVYESEYAIEVLIERSEFLFQWLSDKSEEFNFIPVLEFDALNRYIYDTDLLEAWLVKYPKIRLCLDTARLYLQDRIDPHFHAVDVIRKFVKYADVIHLSNCQFIDKVVQRHFPVLPELSPSEGWAPIEQYLSIIREENSHLRIHFEHRSDYISDEDLERCYEWVDNILNDIDFQQESKE
ncbi:sugar phosphate isomerase/epimerase [Paenibacillus marinisediminis]